MSNAASALAAASVKAAGFLASARSASAAGPFGAAIIGHGALSEYASRSSQAASAEQYNHFSGYTYAIIRTIASRIAGQPIRVARRRPKGESGRTRGLSMTGLPNCFKSHSETAELLDVHELLDVLEHPNSLMVKWTMLFVTVASLELTGRAFWWARRDEVSGREEIWPLPSSWVEAIHTDTELFARWSVRPSGAGEAFEVDNSEMVHFYYPDPSDPLASYAPLQALARSVIADESVEEAQRRTFLNGCNPGLALIVGRSPEVAGVDQSSQPILTEVQRAQVIAAVKRQWRGVKNMDEPLILDGLIKDAKRITTTPRDMDFLASGQQTKSRLAQGWGVNPISMGEIEGANRASSAVADDHLLANVVNPRIELLSQILTRWLGPRYESDNRLLVYIETARSVDIDYELAQASAMMDRGAMSRNEWRARAGLPPIQDGDSALVGGVMIPVVPDPTVDGKSVGTHDTRPAPNGRKTPGLVCAAKSVGVSATAEAMVEAQDEAAAALAESLAAFLTVVRDTVSSAIGDMDSVRANPSGAVDRVFSDNNWDDEIIEVVGPHVRRMVLTGAALEWHLFVPRQNDKGFYDTLRRLPRAVVHTARDIARSVLKLPQWVTLVQRLRERLANAAEIAVADGVAGPPVGEAVRESLPPETVESWSQNVAQTEAVTGINAGQDAARTHLATAGYVRAKRWVSVKDSLVRPTHLAADGQEVPVDAQFIVGGVRCSHPGDLSLPPGERCNCRCVAVSVPL